MTSNELTLEGGVSLAQGLSYSQLSTQGSCLRAVRWWLSCVMLLLCCYMLHPCVITPLVNLTPQPHVQEL